VALILLVWLLKKFLFQKVLDTLDERTAEVRRTHDQMAADREAMHAARADYERRLADIEAEAPERIQAAIKGAQQLREHMVSESRTQGEQLIQRAQEEIQREKRRAMIELRTEMADLAVNAASRILGRAIDPAAQRELIGEFIQEAGQA